MPVKLEFLPLKETYFEDCVNKLVEMHALFAYQLCRFKHFFPVRDDLFLLKRSPGHSNGGERGLELVGHIVDEVAFQFREPSLLEKVSPCQAEHQEDNQDTADYKQKGEEGFP